MHGGNADAVYQLQLAAAGSKNGRHSRIMQRLIYPNDAYKRKHILIGWDVANLEAANAILAGQLPAFYAYHDKDWQSYNAQLVTRYKLEDVASMMEAATSSHHQLMDFLKGIPPEEFDKDRGIRFRGYKVTIARLLEAEMKDEKIHHSQIVAFQQQSESG